MSEEHAPKLPMETNYGWELRSEIGPDHEDLPKITQRFPDLPHNIIAHFSVGCVREVVGQTRGHEVAGRGDVYVQRLGCSNRGRIGDMIE